MTPAASAPTGSDLTDTRAHPATRGVTSGGEILARLLAATPLPPATGEAGSDIEALLAAFEAIMAERAAVIAQIAPPLALSGADRELLAELLRRQDAWNDALGAAQRTVAGQRHGAAQLRAYARRP